MKTKNAMRAERAKPLVEQYRAEHDPYEALDEALTDLLADLGHLADSLGFDGAQVMQRAADHLRFEREADRAA
jgi:hypothetical protein